MMKLIKILLLSTISLVLMAVIAVALAFYLIDPSRYRPAMESVFAKQTGLELRIAGEIEWAFNPVFGLSISDLRLINPNSPAELASLSNIAIKIEPRALLDGRLQMQEFIARDLHINWIVDAQGNGNWPKQTDAEQEGAPSSNSAENYDISAAVAQITVSNASIAIQDAQMGVNSNFENLNFSSQNSNVENRPFPFELGFELRDNIAEQNASISISSTATVDLAQGNARLDDLQIKLNPLQLTGNIAIDDFNNALAWRGQLTSNTFALSDFLDLYARTEEQSSQAALGEYSTADDQFSLNVEFNGNSRQINLPTLAIALDNMRVGIDAGYTFATANTLANLRYNVNANALDLNRYTVRVEAEAAAEDADTPVTPAPASAAAQDIELPIELLQSMNIQARHTIDSLAIAGLQFGSIDAGLTVQAGVLNLELSPVPFYSGQFNGSINYNAHYNPASLTSISSMRNVNVGQLAEALPFAEFAQGRFSVESAYTLRGRTVNQLLTSVTGSTSFSLSDSAIDIGIVKQLFSSISVLSPAGTGDLAQSWPDLVRFNSLTGNLTLEDGIDQGQKLNVSMDNFEIAATGGVNLADENFDYNATLTVFGPPATQTIPVAPLYQGVGWPVACNARFDAPFGEYCGPDFGRVRELFVEISRNEVQRRVQDAVTDRVPTELQDATRGLLDRLRR
jgi:AsmA protein